MNDCSGASSPAGKELNRVFWHSRRGMLELDMLLVPFAKYSYPQLTAEQQGVYQALLACEDTDLLHWLTGQGAPEDEALMQMVNLVRDSEGTVPSVT